ncbi:general substrate transporter [Thamnocephalis sphaerospora]|uniref:General substrate transporter n=1 Tax=Thamnocephalis sphaerospora TaxID=78915 RepID=A0A4P9XME8_9FUNG|nr:general substrate transporter [Thamnocephalis sphaerospora]|eukprot:RKP07078.1 general substrate transporter [Thamnocephalis sphaerospora]
MLNGYMILTVLVSAMGGLLFGYDVGVISGVLIMDSFNETFRFGSETERGFTVSILLIGALVGSLGVFYFADRFGRRRSCMGGSIVFIAGGLMQTFADSLPLLTAGRFISGLSVGVLSMAVPLYLSEVSPKEYRGMMVAMQQLAITVGILLAFCVNYGTERIDGDASWRIPFGVQNVFAIFMAAGMVFLPSSPRWLMSRGRVDQAMCALRRLRNSSGIMVQQELDEIQDSIRLEREIGDGSWKEVAVNGMWRRVLLGVCLQMFQQLTGINAIMYYSPKILSNAGFSSHSVTLLVTAGAGVVNVLMTLPGMYLVDRVGRRVLLLLGAGIMAVAMAILGIMIAIYAPAFEAPAVPWVCLVMLYLFIVGFAPSWGPIGWIYPSEIYPLRIRAKAMSLTTASNWLFNAIVALAVPPSLAAAPWGPMIAFAALLVLMAIWVYFTLPETKGKSLEEVDALFGQDGFSSPYEAKLGFPKGGH